MEGEAGADARVDAKAGACASTGAGARVDAKAGAANAGAGGRAGGNGLRNMRRRMEQIGGTLAIGPGAGGRGTVITLQVPLGEGEKGG